MVPHMNSIQMDRVKLLFESNQIDKEIYEFIPIVLKRVEDELQVQLAEENAGPFVTHLSIALQRIKNQEAIGEIPAELTSLTQKHPRLFEFAKEILSIVSPKVSINAEASFITLYFCLLTGMESEGL
jgi:transcriptional regulatory protein LevR